MAPQLEQQHNLNHATQGCVDLSCLYNGLSNQFVPVVNKCSFEFLNLNFTPYLLSVSKNRNLLWKGDEYFVTQVKVVKDITIFIRLSSDMVSIILDNMIGSSFKGNKLENITELEAKIITAYNNFLYTNIKLFLLEEKEIIKQKLKGKDLCHLTFLVKFNETDEVGKIIISVPEELLQKVPNVEPREDLLSFSTFLKCKTPVNIQVGKTRVKLDDVKHLEPDDIIILENSNLHKMTIKNGFKMDLKINPEPSLVYNLDDGGDEDMTTENNTKNKNIWDDIQVEVGAEFQKVKISLGELRQISEGLVVDIGSVYENEITLSVEEKPIATGELVIIGDRYGVKLNAVYQDAKEEEIINHSESESEEVEASAVEDSTEEDDDFDYSDFDIDDDDI